MPRGVLAWTWGHPAGCAVVSAAIAWACSSSTSSGFHDGCSSRPAQAWRRRAHLHKILLRNVRRFLAELGRDLTTETGTE